MNIEKLKHLWQNRKATLKADSVTAVRVDKLYELVERWERDQVKIATIGGIPSPHEKDIPENSWPEVKRRMLEVYDNTEELKPFRSQVDDVELLLNLANRDERFRIGSNASVHSAHETRSTYPGQQNPESRYASYNYPFEIIRFIFGCKQQGGLDSDLPRGENCEDGSEGKCPAGKFVLKFLWMLARREEAVPIFSLASFRALSPIFRQIASDVDWGDKDYHWSLSLSDFVTRWPEVSAKLSQWITGKVFADLNDDEKKDFAKLIFIASISETTTKNALDTVRTGNKAIILYGPPGTGKTYQAQEVIGQLLKISIQNSAASPQQPNALDACNFSHLFPEPDCSSERPPVDAPSTTISQSGCWALIQFHPTYSYHDFIGGIMPKLTGETLGYVKKEGIFKRFCDAAKDNPEKPFVLVIDEINRADLSSVFGELMYALEYRNKKVDILHFGPFEIPENVYLIGTMNSADKSLVTFDLALRRRFLFFKLMPDMSVLNDWNAKQKPPIGDEDMELLIKKARKLNEAVAGKGTNELGLPQDFGIGQAYFMKIRDFCVMEEADNCGETTRHRITDFSREQLWTYHLEPLLEEYLAAEAEAKKDDLKRLRDAFVEHA